MQAPWGCRCACRARSEAACTSRSSSPASVRAVRHMCSRRGPRAMVLRAPQLHVDVHCTPVQPAREMALDARAVSVDHVTVRPKPVHAHAKGLPDACTGRACRQTCRVRSAPHLGPEGAHVGRCCSTHPTASSCSAPAISSAAAGRAGIGWLRSMHSWGKAGAEQAVGAPAGVGDCRSHASVPGRKIPVRHRSTPVAPQHALNAWRRHTCASWRSSRQAPSALFACGDCAPTPNRTSGESAGALGPAAGSGRACSTPRSIMRMFRSSDFWAHRQKNARHIAKNTAIPSFCTTLRRKPG